jgi:hypothetical protein
MAIASRIRVLQAFRTALQGLRWDDSRQDDPKQIVVRNRSEEEMTKANLGARSLD